MADAPKMKTADDIIALNDRPVFKVNVPEWGIVAKCRELDIKTLQAINESSRQPDGKLDRLPHMAKVILEGCIEPKFEPRHYEALKSKSNSAILTLYNAIIDGKKN